MPSWAQMHGKRECDRACPASLRPSACPGKSSAGAEEKGRLRHGQCCPAARKAMGQMRKRGTEVLEIASFLCRELWLPVPRASPGTRDHRPVLGGKASAGPSPPCSGAAFKERARALALATCVVDLCSSTVLPLHWRPPPHLHHLHRILLHPVSRWARPRAAPRSPGSCRGGQVLPFTSHCGRQSSSRRRDGDPAPSHPHRQMGALVAKRSEPWTARSPLGKDHLGGWAVGVSCPVLHPLPNLPLC